MTKVISMVKALRLKRAPVTAEVINSVAKGFIIANDWSLLIENGGYISLSHQCGCNLLYRMEQEGKEMYRWKSSTEKLPVTSGLLKGAKLHFQRHARVASNTRWPDYQLRTNLTFVCM